MDKALVRYLPRKHRDKVMNLQSFYLTDEYGYASTKDEAISGCIDNIIETFLRSTKEGVKLGPLPKKHLTFLKTILLRR